MTGNNVNDQFYRDDKDRRYRDATGLILFTLEKLANYPPKNELADIIARELDEDGCITTAEGAYLRHAKTLEYINPGVKSEYNNRAVVKDIVSYTETYIAANIDTTSYDGTYNDCDMESALIVDVICEMFLLLKDFSGLDPDIVPLRLLATISKVSQRLADKYHYDLGFNAEDYKKGAKVEA